jgi:threonine/homoserine/homoserine lactone efflux protein
MTLFPSLLAFIAAASILTVTPGLDTALVLRTAAVSGPRPAWFATVGIGLGCLVWGAAVSVGLGALLAASELGYTIVRWAGAAYLLWLGIGLISRPRRGLEPAGDEAAPERDARQALRRGLLTNLLNPKVGVFYITFLPQFVPAGASVAGFSFLLAAIHVVLGLIWFAILIAATVPLGRVLARPRVVTALDRLTGGIFVAFGVKLALTR